MKDFGLTRKEKKSTAPALFGEDDDDKVAPAEPVANGSFSPRTLKENECKL